MDRPARRRGSLQPRRLGFELNALADELIAAERAVWRALVEGDQAADAEALAEDFLGVYPSGFSGKADHVAQLASGPTVASYELSEFQVLDLGEDHALLAYRADYLRTGGSEAEAMFVSSLWRRAGDRWVNLFSQDTIAGGRDPV